MNSTCQYFVVDSASSITVYLSRHYNVRGNPPLFARKFGFKYRKNRITSPSRHLTNGVSIRLGPVSEAQVEGHQV